jgi:uncharacterized SAM-binding protein YcdF (DUF218 family)
MRCRWLLGLLPIGLLIVLLGYPLWLPAIGAFLVASDPPTAADAVVALSGGGRERVVQAARERAAQGIPWFVVTDWPLNLPGLQASYAELATAEAVAQGVPADRILVAPGSVLTTYDEAVATRQLAAERGLRSIVVVTDPFHTGRARRIFQDALRDSGVRVTVRPVEGHWYRPETWWQHSESLRETWTEYVKLVVYLLGYR